MIWSAAQEISLPTLSVQQQNPIQCLLHPSPSLDSEPHCPSSTSLPLPSSLGSPRFLSPVFLLSFPLSSSRTRNLVIQLPSDIANLAPGVHAGVGEPRSERGLAVDEALLLGDAGAEAGVALAIEAVEILALAYADGAHGLGVVEALAARLLLPLEHLGGSLAIELELGVGDDAGAGELGLGERLVVLQLGLALGE